MSIIGFSFNFSNYLQSCLCGIHFYVHDPFTVLKLSVQFHKDIYLPFFTQSFSTGKMAYCYQKKMALYFETQ